MGNNVLKTRTVDGFFLTYEAEHELTIVVGLCPQCGKRIETIQFGFDASDITVEKLKSHLQKEHPG